MIESYTSTATAMTTASGHCLPGPKETVGVQGGLDPDAELMARVAAHGDREAFTRLVDRHKDGLVAYLARLTGCGEQAQDLAQESFLRLYRAAAQYKDRGYFRAYLFRIATNLVRSQERKAKRWRRLTAVVSPASLSARAEIQVLRRMRRGPWAPRPPGGTEGRAEVPRGECCGKNGKCCWRKPSPLYR